MEKDCCITEEHLKEVPKLKKRLLPEKRLEKTARYMKLLSNPTRIQILRLLTEKELCVCAIEKALEKNQPNISQHLTKLKDNRIIASRKKGKYTYYRIRDKKMLEIISVL